MGAELARKRAGEETRTDMSEAKLGEFASKEFVMKDALDFMDNYIKKDDMYYPGLGEVPDNETKPIRRIRRVHSSEPSDKEIRDRLKRVHETRRAGVWPDGPSIGIPSTLTDKEILARAKVKENAARRHGDYDAYHAIEALKAPEVHREEITQTAALNEMPDTEATLESAHKRESVASQQRVAANMAASKKRTAADNAARLELSSEFTSKQKLNYRGAWVDSPVTSKRNVGLNRAIATESKGIVDAARKEKERRRHEKDSLLHYKQLSKEVSKMNHQNFVSQLDGHINHLEKKRRMNTPEESREAFDRDAAKVMSGRQRKRDAELRRERGLPPDNSVTHVDRSVKFRDLETKHGDDDTPQNAEYQAAIASNKAEDNARQAEERTDVARRKAYSRRNRVQDAELLGTEDEYQTALASVTSEDKELMGSGYPSKIRNIDQPNSAVTKSKILHSKDLLPAQDSNGNFISNSTIPFTQETNQLMSLAADAIEKYITKQYDDDEPSTKAARRNKKKVSKRKMKVSGSGTKNSQRIIGKRAAEVSG